MGNSVPAFDSFQCFFLRIVSDWPYERYNGVELPWTTTSTAWDPFFLFIYLPCNFYGVCWDTIFCINHCCITLCQQFSLEGGSSTGLIVFWLLSVNGEVNRIYWNKFCRMHFLSDSQAWRTEVRRTNNKNATKEISFVAASTRIWLWSWSQGFWDEIVLTEYSKLTLQNLFSCLIRYFTTEFNKQISSPTFRLTTRGMISNY